MLPSEIRLRAQAVSEAAQRLVKEILQLRQVVAVVGFEPTTFGL